MTYACTGDSQEIVRICPSLGIASDGTRFMTDAAGNKLMFNLYSDESRITVWGTWYGKVKAPTIDVPMGRSQKASGTAIVYARVDAGQQSVPPGVYKTAIEGNNSVFAYDYASKGTCQSPIKGAGERAKVPVSLTARVGDGGPGSQPMVAPDATHTSGAGSAEVNHTATPQKTGVWQKLSDNARYQQQRQNSAGGGARSGPKPLCKMSDADVHLVDGTWAGPNCIAVDGDGKPVHPEEVQTSAGGEETASRAAYIESHSCMTTAGAEKANALVEDCTHVTSGAHSVCNAQQHTCDEIHDATKRGCDGLGASAPDFCMTRYN
jgi:hypothetical protein